MALYFDQMTIQAYLDAEYFLAPISEFFKVGCKHKNAEDFFLSNSIKTYAWLTAVNPRSKVLSDIENQKRMQALKADLNGHISFEGSSRSPDGKWEEKGIWVCGRDMQFLRNLGEKYDQNAFTFAVMDHSMQLIIL